MVRTTSITALGFLLCISISATCSAALVVNPAANIIGSVTVQPIIVSDDDGSNQANYFGTAGEQQNIFDLVDTIWAQAGIDIEFLAPDFWNSSFANEGVTTPRPQSDLGTIRNDATSAGLTNANPSVLNMFMVNVVPGFSPLSANQAAGLATLGGNGIAQYVGTNLLGFLGGREVIASVVAHEIGHNLGLAHNSIAENLMATGNITAGERLNATQIANVLNSQFITPVAVPLPAALWLFSAALVGIHIRLRSRSKVAFGWPQVTF